MGTPVRGGIGVYSDRSKTYSASMKWGLQNLRSITGLCRFSAAVEVGGRKWTLDFPRIEIGESEEVPTRLIGSSIYILCYNTYIHRSLGGPCTCESDRRSSRLRSAFSQGGTAGPTEDPDAVCDDPVGDESVTGSTEVTVHHGVVDAVGTTAERDDGGVSVHGLHPWSTVSRSMTEDQRRLTLGSLRAGPRWWTTLP